MVEEVLAEFMLYVVTQGVGGRENSVPGRMAFDCFVCWSKEGRIIELVEGGDETGALEEAKKVGVVRVGGECVDEGCGDGGGEGLLCGVDNDDNRRTDED
jgi:hypothetical protein